jgi:glycogen debranching enzyme
MTFPSPSPVEHAPPSAEECRRIERGALALLRRNRRWARHPGDGRRLRYTCPSPGHYPFQWFWDSCFHAVALAHLEPEAAREELELLLSVQPSSGFLPHIIFWDRFRLANPGLFWAWVQSSGWRLPRHSALIQPPVLAACVERYQEVTGDSDFVRRVLPALDRYYGYLGRERASGGSPLLTILGPWESGTDHRPSYDVALGLPYPGRPRDLVVRPRLIDLANRRFGWAPEALNRRGRFRVQDVLVNAVYADGLRTLARLHGLAGDGEGGGWQRRAETAEAAMLATLRGEDGFFYDRDQRSGRLLPARTVAGLLPLLSASLGEAEAAPLIEALDDPEQFRTPYPAPSVAVREPSFLPGELRRGSGILIWRGPTWINTNWLLWRALRRRGEEERARRLAASAAALVLRSGFREYYDPFSGRGLGATSFGWSTLVVDMLPGTTGGN